MLITTKTKKQNTDVVTSVILTFIVEICNKSYVIIETQRAGE